MRKLILTGLVFINCHIGSSQTKNFLDQPYLETFASVDTLVSPDRIYLNIILTEKDTRGKVSIEELEANMISVLSGIGIDTEENLTLNDLASNFSKYFLKPQDVLKAKGYTLKISDAKTAGNVIIQLEKINVSNILLDKTEYSQLSELKMKLLSKAVEKAKLQAEMLIQPLNQNLGPAIHISDVQYNSIPNTLQGRASGIQIRGATSITASSVYELPEIEFEKIRVEKSVSIKFKLVE